MSINKVNSQQFYHLSTQVDNAFVRLASSYLEVKFSYSNSSTVTEADIFSKIFNIALLKIDGTIIEIVKWLSVGYEVIDYYTSDYDITYTIKVPFTNLFNSFGKYKEIPNLHNMTENELCNILLNITVSNLYNTEPVSYIKHS